MSERDQLEQAIATLEQQRAILGDAVVNAALASMREKLAALQAQSPAAHEAQQRKQVTVLFADVSGFTAMSETMDAEEVTATMNALWTRLDGAITRYGGRIDKHIGDAVMALFGTPVAREDDPERAIRAALAMQTELSQWRTQAGSGSPSAGLQMRIGINTGPVLLGAIGSTGEYTAMGDTVNLASRLEHAAPVGGILVSHDTYRHVRGLFEVQPLLPISVKGKSDLIQVYVVGGARPRAFRVPTRGVEGIETRTVGRKDELRQLQSALFAAREGQRTHLVSIVAEAGVGKSRLLYEFGNWLELMTDHPLVFKGRATQEMMNLPYALVRDVLAFQFNIQDSDRAAMARDKLERGLIEIIGADGAQKAHFVGHLIGFDFSGSPYLQGILGDAQQIRSRAFHYITQLFAEVTRRQAAVIMLEDLHWADDGSLDLVDHLMRERPDLPILIVTPTRPTLFERRPNWGEGPAKHVRLDLKPLSEHNSRRLVAEILRKASEVPAALQDLIVSRAEGSPFYVEELIKMLIEDGVIVTSADHWQVELGRLSETRVPATLTGVLQARLDGLPPPERETLQQASIVGRVFWSNVVERLRGVAGAEIGDGESLLATSDWLGTLNGRELIFRRDGSAFAGTREYVFKHAILHEVTYESVLKRLRRMYHAQVAECLIELSGERSGEFAGRIGEHYERAGEWARAAEWYGRAGKQAQDTYLPEAAIGYYQKALEFWKESGNPPDRLAQRLDVYEGLGQVLVYRTRYTEAVETYTTMRAAAEAAGDAATQARAWYGVSMVQSYQGDHRAALDSASRAEAIASAANARTELAMALEMKGWSLYRLGEAEAALTLGEQMQALATELGNRRRKARSLNLLGAAHNILGHYPQANSCWQDALAIFRELGDRGQGMPVLSNLGVIAEARGDYGGALTRYQEALAVAREIGSRDGEVVYLNNLGTARVRLGEYQAAEADLRQAIQMAGLTGSWVLANAHVFLAEACLRQGKIEEALAAARRALALGQESEEPEDIAAAWRVLGRVASSLRQPIAVDSKDAGGALAYDAAACFAESLRVCKETGLEDQWARTLRAWATYELKSGDRERGATMWQEARDIFTRLGAEREVERMNNLPARDEAA